jgi:putative transposase
VQRRFTADRPNALWLADVTYCSTDEGWLYLAVVLDVFSHYVVGWAMDARLGSQLVLAALEMAYAQRCPDDVIHHSDYFGHALLLISVREIHNKIGLDKFRSTC